MRGNIMKIVSVLVILVLGFFVLRMLSSKDNTETETLEGRTKIVFFGLGKADSIYIENSTKSILIDAGLKSNREELIEKLEDLNVERLDYVILTHADKDHIGSASYILDRFEIGEVVQSQNIKDSKREDRIEEVLQKKTIKNTRPTEDMEFLLGDLKVSIFVPKKDYYEKDNDYSLVTLIEDGNLNYLFAGDAEEELLYETLDLDLPQIDLYKVAHHGRENPNSDKLIKKISPKNSVITNSLGETEVATMLKLEGSKIKYVFDKDLECISDGRELSFDW